MGGERLIRMCAITHSYVCNDSFMCVLQHAATHCNTHIYTQAHRGVLAQWLQGVGGGAVGTEERSGRGGRGGGGGGLVYDVALVHLGTNDLAAQRPVKGE